MQDSAFVNALGQEISVLQQDIRLHTEGTVIADVVKVLQLPIQN